jgi:hypothetical protein
MALRSLLSCSFPEDRTVASERFTTANGCGAISNGLDPSTDKAVIVAEHAAISRLLPIQDGPNCWEEHWRCAETDLGGPAPS